MANWKTVTERWLPIVENMEEHDMDDYAIPEIYRAAENAIDELVEALEGMIALHNRLSEELHDAEVGLEVAKMIIDTLNKATEAVRKTKRG